MTAHIVSRRFENIVSIVSNRENLKHIMTVTLWPEVSSFDRRHVELASATLASPCNDYSATPATAVELV